MGRYLKTLSLSALVLFAACSKDSPTTPDTKEDTPPEIPDISTLTIAVPPSMPGEIQGMVSSANLLALNGTTLFNLVSDQQPTLDNGTWTWTYTNGSLTITLMATVNSDETVTWKLVADGTFAYGEISFDLDEWVVMTGTATLDGKSGSWTIFNPNKTTVLATASWDIDDAGTATVNLKSGDDSFEIDVTASVDGSGEITIKKDGAVVYMAEWTKDEGSWTSYDPDTGNETGSGSW